MFCNDVSQEDTGRTTLKLSCGIDEVQVLFSTYPPLIHGSHTGEHAAREGVFLAALLVPGKPLTAAYVRKKPLQQITV